MPTAFLLALIVFHAPAQTTEPAELVKQLGDEAFAVREKAREELLKLGPAAEAALRKGTADQDIQVREISQQLLNRLLEAKRAGRLQAFLDDKDDRLNPPLPGWKRFSAVAGNGPAERKRFLAIYQAAEATLEEVERDPKKAVKTLDAHIALGRQILLTSSEESDVLRELTTLLFLASDTRIPLDAAASGRVCTVLTILAERTAMTKVFRADATARKLVRTFLVERCDPTARVPALTAALGLELNETADWALGLALGKDNPPVVRGWAVILAGKVGDKDAAARLEPLLADHTVVGTSKLGEAALTAELADVTLAVLIRANGQKEADYGFPYSQAIPGLKTLPAPERLGFSDLPTRQAAFKKWENRKK
jgi:hypothetical protein